MNKKLLLFCDLNHHYKVLLLLNDHHIDHQLVLNQMILSIIQLIIIIEGNTALSPNIEKIFLSVKNKLPISMRYISNFNHILGQKNQ